MRNPKVWIAVFFAIAAFGVGTAGAQVNYAHNYLRQPCCGGDLLRGVRASITMNGIDTAGDEALTRIIARASSSLSDPGMIQAGYTVTNDVFPNGHILPRYGD